MQGAVQSYRSLAECTAEKTQPQLCDVLVSVSLMAEGHENKAGGPDLGKEQPRIFAAAAMFNVSVT